MYGKLYVDTIVYLIDNGEMIMSKVSMIGIAVFFGGLVWFFGLALARIGGL